ncbi:MAG: hypothetical protein AB1896_13205 [Thermodesulfobacteriota bacterium]
MSESLIKRIIRVLQDFFTGPGGPEEGADDAVTRFEAAAEREIKLAAVKMEAADAAAAVFEMHRRELARLVDRHARAEREALAALKAGNEDQARKATALALSVRDLVTAASDQLETAGRHCRELAAEAREQRETAERAVADLPLRIAQVKLGERLADLRRTETETGLAAEAGYDDLAESADVNVSVQMALKADLRPGAADREVREALRSEDLAAELERLRRLAEGTEAPPAAVPEGEALTRARRLLAASGGKDPAEPGGDKTG